MSPTNLPPAVLAGLYKQIVIPAAEAAALAELAEAHGVTAKVAGAGTFQSADGDTEAGSGTGPSGTVMEAKGSGQSAAAAASPGSDALKGTAPEGRSGLDHSSKTAASTTKPGADAADASAKDARPVSGKTERPVQAPVEPAKEVQPLSALADEAASHPLITGPDPSSSADAAASSSTYKFLGRNLKQVVVIVRSPKEPFLPEDHLQFLTKMLGACQLNLGDVAIVNDATRKADIQLLKAQLQPARMLLFGVAPAEIGLPLTFPQFKEQEYAGCSYLYSPSLLDLNRTSEEAKDLKRKLWECLKKMFNV